MHSDGNLFLRYNFIISREEILLFSKKTKSAHRHNKSNPRYDITLPKQRVGIGGTELKRVRGRSET